MYLHDRSIIEYSEDESINSYIERNKSTRCSDELKPLKFKLLVILPAAFLLSIILYFSYSLLLPSISKRIVSNIPSDFAQEVGDDALKSLDETTLQPSKLLIERQVEIREYFNKSSFTKGAEAKYSVVFRSSNTLGANAFALPNGTIILLDDLIQLAANNDEIISVFAHEAGHIYHKHAFQKLVQNSILTIGLVLITGDITSVAMLAGLVPVFLIQQSYSREAEAEADDFAIGFLKRNNIDPNNFASILAKITNSHDLVNSSESIENTQENKYLRSHPRTEERIKIIRQNL
jgi:Zn-dependent protease with chaperone function